MKSFDIGCLVTDFSPLRVPRKWVEEVSEAIGSSSSGLSDEIAFYQVDAHNVVPCWEASDKLEYGARTIRYHFLINRLTQNSSPTSSKPRDI
jgi:deoxyribodipyrimidine photo-lyase